MILNLYRAEELKITDLPEVIDPFRGKTANDGSKRKRVVVDFPSPNVAQKMNIGHLRSTIMADSICRLFEFIGWDVKRKRQYEDEGSKIGTIIAELDQIYKNLLLE